VRRFGARRAVRRELADERVQSRQRQRRARLVRVVEPERGVVGTELSSRTGDVVAAALDLRRRRAIDGVVAARRRVRDAADVDADAADVDADAAVHHLLPDAVVAVTGTVAGTVDVRRRRRGFVSRLVRFVHLPRRDERRPDVLLRRHVRRVRRLLRRRRRVLSIAG